MNTKKSWERDLFSFHFFNKTLTSLFFWSFSKYFLSTYHMPGTVLTGNIAKGGEICFYIYNILALMELTFH